MKKTLPILVVLNVVGVLIIALMLYNVTQRSNGIIKDTSALGNLFVCYFYANSLLYPLDYTSTITIYVDKSGNQLQWHLDHSGSFKIPSQSVTYVCKADGIDVYERNKLIGTFSIK